MAVLVDSLFILWIVFFLERARIGQQTIHQLLNHAILLIQLTLLRKLLISLAVESCHLGD
jgi:hypothetical protein